MACRRSLVSHTLPRFACLPARPRYVFEPAAANREEVLKAVREMRGR